ncbi:hypothetical protein HKCCE2091_03300 [Rhodobacterales bacterium HKCCE2091]|nr:hypothetical protein [Rhodobacterales bacterium HKCCE2091]
MTVHAFRPGSDTGLSCRVTLGMAELSPFGLSEQWLLRACGDRHWRMIARHAGLPGIDFRDAGGRPVYAAFCASSLRMTRPARPLLAREIGLRSALFQVGPNRIGSVHRVTAAEGVLAELSMISCFLRHDADGSNRGLMRGALPGLGPLPDPPPGLTALAGRAREAARAVRGQRFGEAGPPILSCTPVPSLDFNAVGLLYFPTYSRIAETARPAVGHLDRREVVYLGNLDPGERVEVFESGAALVLRTPEGRPLAAVTTT